MFSRPPVGPALAGARLQPRMRRLKGGGLEVLHFLTQTTSGAGLRPARGLQPRQRRLKGGGSQDWLPHSGEIWRTASDAHAR